MRHWFALAGFMLALTLAQVSAGENALKAGPNDNQPPKGFTALFNGKDLSGWQALVMAPDPNDTKGKKPRSIPAWLAKLPADEMAKKQQLANESILPHWKIKDGIIEYTGKGNNLQTVKEYGNFELFVDWRIEPSGDSGLYLRGNPQVQIWDIKGKNNKAGIGSGGLYNNQKNPSNPIAIGDNPAGEWNTCHVVMVGDKVTIKLNGKLVVDNTPLENYWFRGQPLPERGPIELQHHGDKLWFKNIYVKELPN